MHENACVKLGFDQVGGLGIIHIAKLSSTMRHTVLTLYPLELALAETPDTVR
jgi:hypothetical protein